MIYPQQQAYKDAKRIYNELIQISGERQNAILDTWEGDLTSDAALERYAEMATRIEFEIGLPQASQALRQAEGALMAWGVAYCTTHPGYTPVMDILAETKHIGMRTRVCDAMLRLGLFDKGARQ